jgi:hypothetical protein
MTTPCWRILNLPDEIDRVFMDAAMDGLEGVLWLHGRSHQGRFSLPGAPAEVVFRTHLPVQARPDDHVRIVMLTGRAHYRFEARLHHHEGNTLHLDRPRTVALMDRRQSPRVPVSDTPGVCLVVGTGADALRWELADMSTTGLGAIVPAGGAVPTDRSVDGFLELPDRPPLAVRLRVRNVRQTDAGAVVGFYIADMTAEGRAILEAEVTARLGSEAA